jgi:hypothetical protein
MPAPDELTMTGSGKIVAPELAPRAKVNIAGSGDVETQALAIKRLEVNIAGIGLLSRQRHGRGSGSEHRGQRQRRYGRAEGRQGQGVDHGFGRRQFASDGKVKASMMGSGSVHVKGHATCEVSAMGSGKLVCEP